MNKYRLYIKQYDIATNDYKVRKETIETNDIYHEIGRIYSTALTEIKRIDYEKIDEVKPLKRKLERIKDIIDYWGVDEEHNDDRILRSVLKDILEVIVNDI